MPWTSKSAALVGLTAIACVLYLALAGPMGSSVAFANVALKLREASTLSFDTTVTFDADKKNVFHSRTYFMVPGKSRQEMHNAHDEGFVVMDFPAGKAVMVSTTAKTAMVSEIKGGQKFDMAQSEIAFLRSLADKESQPLGEKQIDGVRAKGFKITDELRTTTVWANAETGAPIRIEMKIKRTPAGPCTEVLTNFQLDAEFDPELFSLAPPEGFKVTQFLPIDLNTSPANMVAGFLKLYAKHMDGAFPDNLDDALKNLAPKLKPAKDDGLPTDELQQAAFYGAGMAAITTNGKQGERWQYYPDVEFGQKDHIVFWYFDAKKNTYTAVYGDLRVEPVAKAQLPEDRASP